MKVITQTFGPPGGSAELYWWWLLVQIRFCCVKPSETVNEVLPEASRLVSNAISTLTATLHDITVVGAPAIAVLSILVGVLLLIPRFQRERVARAETICGVVLVVSLGILHCSGMAH